MVHAKARHTQVLSGSEGPGKWKILVVDDEPAIHDITRIVLSGFNLEGKNLLLIHAYSSDEARQMIRAHSDIALILLDIVLETETAGLELIHWVRKKERKTLPQIIVRTGNPGSFSEQEMIETYAINDYILKSEMTAQRLKTIVSGSIRAFADKFKLKTELKEKQRIEQRLKEKERLLKDIIENVGDILWEVDQNMIYTYISKNAAALTGFPASSFIGRSFYDFLVPESRTAFIEMIQSRFLDTNSFSHIEIMRKNQSGEIQYYLVSGNPVFKNNVFSGYRGADLHITDLKQAEIEKERLIAELRQAQRLEAMGTLAGGIAHDFNNILGGILGYAQLLQFELKAHPNCLAYTDHIVTGCNRAKNLILQILDFSRQRKQVSNTMLTNPIEIVSETTKLLRASFPSSIKIKSDINKDTGCIQADPSQIHQAVMNLCTNARQAIEDGRGAVNIRVDEITHAFDSPIPDLKLELPFGTYILISVKDTGKGIEIDTLDKIFNPYFTTKKRGDGTGLGLSVVHGIVTRFNGAITTQTRPGEGTVFTLYFPKYTKEQQKLKSTTPSLVSGDARILFIDDEPMLVELGKKMLEKLGYTVTAFDSPVKALDKISRNPGAFDLVITDMTMPDMYGTQLAKKIKQLNPQIPIVLASGFSHLSKANIKNPTGIAAILPKPIEITALSQTLSRILN